MATGSPTFGDTVQRRILAGANRLADLADLTLGPSGRTVMIGRGTSLPLLGGSGYGVATHVDVADPVAQMGVQALRNMAWELLRERGDGTATAICLARELLSGLVRMASAGHDPHRLGEAMEQRGRILAARLRAGARRASDVATLAAVATAAAGGDAGLGRTVGEAVHAAGTQGAVVVEAGHGACDETDVKNGLHFGSGWLSEAFVTDEALGRAVYEDAYILVAGGCIDNFGEILPMLEVFAERRKPLVIIAAEVRGEALSTLVLNRRRAGALLAAVAAPGEGDWKALHLGDIAAATGATMIGDESGYRLRDMKPALIGRAARIEIGRRATTITGGGAHPPALEARKTMIRASIDRSRDLAYDREQHERRLARLSGAIATLRIGAASGPALDERLERARCAVCAARSALSGGVVAGGGTSLLRAAAEEARAGSADGMDHAVMAVLQGACAAPLRAIAANCGRDGRRIVAELHAGIDPAAGYDAARDRIADLFTAGIVDAGEVTAEALTHAISTAVNLAGIAVAVSSNAVRSPRGHAPC